MTTQPTNGLIDWDDDCCAHCGGDGFVANCQDEIACLYPEDGCEWCLQPCEFCNIKPRASQEQPQ